MSSRAAAADLTLQQVSDGRGDSRPCRRLRIDQFEVTDPGELHEVDTFALGGFVPGIIAAETDGNVFVSTSMNQVLERGFCDGELHRVGLPVQLGNLRRCASHESHYRILAQMLVVAASEISYPRQREHAGDGGLVGGGAKREMAAGGMSHHKYPLLIELVLRARGLETGERGQDVVERAWPATSRHARAAVLNVPGRKSECREGRTQMPSVNTVVPGPPEASVNIHHDRVRRLACGKTEFCKLLWIIAIANGQIRLRRGLFQDEFRRHLVKRLWQTCISAGKGAKAMLSRARVMRPRLSFGILRGMAVLKNIAAIAKGMSITFGEMFAPTVVENYPDGPGPLKGAKFQERFRGMHVLQRDENGLEKCVACFLCAAACPSNCIYIEAAENTEEQRVSGAERYAKVYNIDYNRCIFCGYCVEACPTDAITHGHGFELATFNVTSLIYRKEQMLAVAPAHIGANQVFNAQEVSEGEPAVVAPGE